MSKARLERLKEVAKKGQYPTTQGNRKAETRGPGILAAANKFHKSTNPAASALKTHKRRSSMKDYE